MKKPIHAIVLLAVLFAIASCGSKSRMDKLQDLYFRAYLTDYSSLEIISQNTSKIAAESYQREIDFQYKNSIGITKREKVKIETYGKHYVIINYDDRWGGDLAKIELNRLIAEGKITSEFEMGKVYDDLEKKYKDLTN